MTRSRLVLGVAFIAIGVVILLDQAGRVSALALVVTWWPLLIVLIGVAQAVTRPRNPVGGMVVGSLGGLLLLDTLAIVDTFTLLWPLLLVGSGVWLMTRRPGSGSGVPGHGLEVLALFNDREATPTGSWAGQVVTAVFGDVHLDLRQVALSREGTLQLTTLFGDVEVVVPPAWEVTVSGPELFGAARVEPSSAPTPAAPVLHVRLVAIFGDLRVRRDTQVTA